MRREKEIAETKCEMAGSEVARLEQKNKHLVRQLEEAERQLAEEREKSQIASVSASQHAEVLSKLESFNLLRDSNRLMREEKEELEQKVRKGNEYHQS